MNTEILIAGFGGQGILFAGKFLAYGAMIKDMNVSWLPSYGPEMRGGTANCSVILGDEAVGSPIVSNPDVLIAMNLPSFEKYEMAVKKGGKMFIDSSLIDKKTDRTDTDNYYIPATQLASDNGLEKLANMIMIGHMLSKLDIVKLEDAREAMKKLVPAGKEQLVELNIKAIELGYNY